MSTSETGLLGAMVAIQEELGKHLASLSKNYLAYIEADDNGARVLTAAAHPELAGHASSAKAGGPSGW